MVRIEDVLSLVQKIAGLRCHVHWRVRADIQSQLRIAQTSASLLTIKIQIQWLRLHPIRFLLLLLLLRRTSGCLETVARIGRQPAQVEIQSARSM